MIDHLEALLEEVAAFTCGKFFFGLRKASAVKLTSIE